MERTVEQVTRLLQLKMKKTEAYFEQLQGGSWERLKDDCYIAGNAISCLFLGMPVNDFDIWFSTQEVASFFCLELLPKIPVADIISSSGVAVLLSTREQFIFSNPEVLSPLAQIASFDFCHLQSYFSLKTGKLCISQEVVDLHSSRQLVVNSQKRNNANLLWRAFKFVAQGWILSEHQFNILIDSTVACLIESGAVGVYNPDSMYKFHKGKKKSSGESR